MYKEVKWDQSVGLEEEYKQYVESMAISKLLVNVGVVYQRTRKHIVMG